MTKNYLIENEKAIEKLKNKLDASGLSHLKKFLDILGGLPDKERVKKDPIFQSIREQLKTHICNSANVASIQTQNKFNQSLNYWDVGKSVKLCQKLRREKDDPELYVCGCCRQTNNLSKCGVYKDRKNPWIGSKNKDIVCIDKEYERLLREKNIEASYQKCQNFFKMNRRGLSNSYIRDLCRKTTQYE